MSPSDQQSTGDPQRRGRLRLLAKVLAVGGALGIFLAVGMFLALDYFTIKKDGGPGWDRIRCTKNKRAIWFEAFAWAVDHQEKFPTHWDFIFSEGQKPNMLICPSDKVRKPAASWDLFTPENVTYEIVTPSAPIRGETNVFLRCPIHGHEAMTDGWVGIGADLTNAR